MAIITDPDNLDRYQVLVDYVNQNIGIKPVKSNDARVDLQTDGIAHSGTSIFGGSVNFTTSGVVSGDILVILEGDNINHHVITGVIENNTGLGVFGTFYKYDTASEINLSYAVMQPTGGTVVDGATLQAIYSFLKEEWRTQEPNMPDLIKHTFPLESITREQFEIGGTTHQDWDWRDDDTKNLIRTGGWAQINSTGLTESEYAGMITLGTLDDDAQVYYLQVDGGTPVNFVLTGPVNQAIKTYEKDVVDYRNFLKLFVRKKARTYEQSEIADIGVTTLETIVNRFPLAHTTDPAIVATDGALAGTSVYQTTAFVADGTGGRVTAQAAATVEQTFTFIDNTATFQTDNLVAKDTIFFKESNNTGYYEIVSVDSETQMTLLQEPSVAITTVTDFNYTTLTRVRSLQKTNGRVYNYESDANQLTGVLESVTATFSTDSVAANDILAITTGNNSYVGVYKVLSVVNETGLYINTIDQAFPDAPYSGVTFTVYRPGMFLQFKSADATQVTDTIEFANLDPDTIRRYAGNFVTDGFEDGMSVTVTSATNINNNGSFIVDTVTTGILTLIAEEALTNSDGDTAAVVDGNVGFVRTMNAVDYPFNWRMFGNNGSLSQCFQWIQKELRRTTDIDASEATARGDITDLLMAFATPTATTTNMFIDDLASADFNNVTKKDSTGDSRNFAFIASVVINLNTNIINSTSAKVTVFFTNDDAGDNLGRDFGTDDAIVVQTDVGANMSATNPASSPLTYNFDYDNNAQRGSAAAGQNAPITIVAIGTDTAQYVQTVGTIQRQSQNIFSLVAALERNYSNP